MKHKSIIIYLILFLLIAVASAFILHHTKKIESTLPEKVSIDSFANDATFTEYNKQGLIKTKAEALKVIHYEPAGTTEFTNPTIVTYTEARREWHIRADKGVSDKTGNTLVLSGNVDIHELPNGKHDGTRIKTKQMTIYPKEYRAETNEAVLLTRPGVTVHGKGFTANLKTGKYQLHSESRVIYQPEK